MAGVGGDVDGGRELAEIESKDPSAGRLFRRLLEGINTLAKNTASSATGEVKPPKPPDAVSVSIPTPTATTQTANGGGESMHVSISHSGELQRGVLYFTEISPNDPSFRNPIVIHHGASRTSHPFTLPTFSGTVPNSNPDNPPIPVPYTYYVRSYAQYPNSQPSRPTTVGSPENPTPFQMSGTTIHPLVSSTGSGTASNTGQQGAWGVGKIQKRN